MIEIRHDYPLDPRAVARLLAAAGMPRPTEDLPRIARMFHRSSLVVSAWNAGRLVGVCRGLTDFSFACYVSELAVDPEFQNQGVGRSLVQHMRDVLGEEVSLILLSVPGAVPFYRRLGFERSEVAYVLPRTR